MDLPLELLHEFSKRRVFVFQCMYRLNIPGGIAAGS